MAANIIDSFLVALGFETDSSGAVEYQEDMEKLTLSLTTVAAAAGAAAAAIAFFVAEVADGLDTLGDFAEQEDYSAAKLNELGYAAQLSGSSLDAVKSSLSAVNKTVGEAVLGIGRGAATFQKLNMQAKNADGTVKTFDEILGEVADKMQNMSRQEGVALAEKLGIDRSLIPLLLKGSSAIEELREEARAFGAVTEEDFDKAGAFNDSLDRMKFVIKSLGQTIALGLMPPLGKFIDGLRSWLVENKDIIKTNLSAFFRVMSVVIGTVFEYVMRAVEGFKTLTNWLMQFRLVTIAATTALAALIGLQVYRWTQDAVRGMISLVRWLTAINFAALLIPAAIGLVVLALGLLVDEFINFREGNESFLGDLIKEFPQLGGAIDAIGEGIQDVFDWGMKLAQQLGPAFGDLGTSLLNLFTALWPVVRFLGSLIGSVLSSVLPVVINVFSAILQVITFTIEAAVLVITALVTAFSVVVNGISTAITTLVGLFTSAASMIRSAFSAVFDWLLAKFDTVVGGFKSAVSWVSGLVGSTPPSAMSGDGGGFSSFQGNGGLGVGATPSTGSNSSVTNSVQTGDIIVQSPDPSQAGQNVKDALNESNRQALRNGESAVLI